MKPTLWSGLVTGPQRLDKNRDFELCISPTSYLFIHCSGKPSPWTFSDCVFNKWLPAFVFVLQLLKNIIRNYCVKWTISLKANMLHVYNNLVKHKNMVTVFITPISLRKWMSTVYASLKDFFFSILYCLFPSRAILPNWALFSVFVYL